MGYLLQLFNETQEVDNPEVAKYVASLILVVVMSTIIFFYHHTGYGQQKIGMRVRIALSSLVYRKITKLSTKSLQEISSGGLVNLLSNDVQRFDSVATALHSIWIAPFQIGIVTYFLWDKIGVVCLAGILSMVSLTLFQTSMGRMASNIRSKLAKKTDKRVNLMNEIISGIQVIKMYAWEKPFEKLVDLARIDEVKAIKTANYIRAIFLSSMVFIERTTLFFTVIAYVLTENDLSSDMVFTVAQFLNVLQSAVAVMLPLAIQSGAESLVSIQRIKTFLLLEEKKIKNYQEKSLINNSVEIEKVFAGFNDNIILKNIDLEIPKGSLCVIIGNVGSGKSSILNLLLQEIELKSGTVKMNGKLSFSSQEPWIFNSSVRNNIIFENDYDELKYKVIAEVCALETDFNQFPNNDFTIISEKGHSLSGGQKSRINLARSIYKEADIYLLDDPLSAVDSHVAKHIFNECIVEYLQGKTRILVTHQIQFLNKADFIVVIKDGQIDFKGTFDQLKKEEIIKFFDIHQEEERDDKTKRKIKKNVRKSTGSLILDQEKVDYQKNIFFEYIKSSTNSLSLTILILVLIITQFACNSADYWISFWTDQVETQSQTINQDTSIYIYSSIIASIIIFTVIRSYLFFAHASIASKNLHSKMFNSLLRFPMKFFNTNSSGRILNRFSKDTGAMDEILPRVLSDTIQVILVMIGSFALIIIANVWMTIAIVVLILVFLGVRKWFLVTAKSIKHVEGVVKSPMFSMINSSLSGLITIRAFNNEMVLINQFDELQDVHTSSWFLLLSCMASFGLWLDQLCVLFLACIVFSFAFISEHGDVSGAMVGLAISQAIGLTGMIQYGMMQVAEVINQFTSVERILHYTTLKKEETDDENDNEKNSEWAKNGNIEFKNTSLKYNSEKVLDNLNFTVNPGEKIGIVGRTGAGKSSIISVLFRLFDIEGKVLIGNEDIERLSLKELRSKITIIPQDPVLFSNTIRFNLDPFGEFQDIDLWNALCDVKLKSSIPNLDYQIKEGGSNLSTGQRQLVCLARALIRKNKILILDEATANVDIQTDHLIQETIKNNFKSCTILSIAHRLNTIVDSNRVLVMDDGKLVEFDHPYLLLQKKNGYFKRMVEDTGINNASGLLEICKRNYEVHYSKRNKYNT
ncbi:probable multidrug resistance-associated protein lethal(2)03659 [Onthophagus taurus]|uniref:probable multidrug resistance-associated protein lethal(2)03659 n=1 Tax=Onthophagus taurus TaxID=166361 RepID=UPI0039BE8508